MGWGRWMSAISQPVAAEPAAPPPAPSASQTQSGAVEDLMAQVQGGAVEATRALDLLADLSRPAGASLATLSTVARAIAVLRDAGEISDRQVVRALAGQCLVAAMLIDADDPAGTAAMFREALCERVRAEGTPVLASVSAAVVGAVAAGRGELRLDQAVYALASFAHLGHPFCLDDVARSLARLPLSDRTAVHLLRQVILRGPAEHRPGAGALLLTFARARSMSDAQLLGALADPDPCAAVRLLVALLGQNDAATANPGRPPLGWDVIAIGLHWLVAEGVSPDRLLAAVAAETVGLPGHLSAILTGMARKIAMPSARPAHAPWHPHGWPTPPA